MVLKRKASHAGSWYSSSPKELASQLEEWLNQASEGLHSQREKDCVVEKEGQEKGPSEDKERDTTFKEKDSKVAAKGPTVGERGSSVHERGPTVRGIIAPHAGYRHSGPCAAYAYTQINPQSVKRIFILGPSHRKRFDGCALTQTAEYETPLGNLIVDKAINEELMATGQFQEMELSTDENEHSIEMQLPYIAKIMNGTNNQYTIIPILVGSIHYAKQAKYGQILSKYLHDEECFFIISSDFCHWGSRFSYTYHDKSKGAIHESIEDLDKQGMQFIENLDTGGFQAYLDRYSNTICGRRPIGVFLNAINEADPGKDMFSFKFVKYVQNRKCRTLSDSSVSYAAGALTLA